MFVLEIKIHSAVVWFGTLLTIATSDTTCPQPDVPYGGLYEPADVSHFSPGARISYSCRDNLTLIGEKTRTCLSLGRWSGKVPFCEESTPLRNPITDVDSARTRLYAIDGSAGTCFRSRLTTGVKLTVFLAKPATVHHIKVHLSEGPVHFKIDLVENRANVVRINTCTIIEGQIVVSEPILFACHPNDLRTDRIIIQDQSAQATVLGICEIEVFVKNDNWCEDPPDHSLFIPNGFLSVSRSKSNLHCAAGYRAKGSGLVCEKNAWVRAGSNMQCDEILCEAWTNHVGEEWHLFGDDPRKLAVGIQRQLRCSPGFKLSGQPDTLTCMESGLWSEANVTCQEIPDKSVPIKLIAISAGAGGVVLLCILLALTVFLCFKKRTEKVVVIYKPTEPNPTDMDNEYGSVYYDTIRSDTSTMPPMMPVTPMPEYAKTLKKLSPKPADIAFGTLKPSMIYG